VLVALEQPDSAGALAVLERRAAGQAFPGEFRAFLEQCGHRAPERGLSAPTWLEDPAPVLALLRENLRDGVRDLDADLEAAASERERLTEQAFAKLAGYPLAIREKFRSLLRDARFATVLSEDHGFWIDFYATSLLREVVLECGRRLAGAGVLERRDDVVHLGFAELRGALAGDGPPDLRALVAERKAELERFRGVATPLALGVRPAGAPPDTPLTRARSSFFGAAPPPSGERGVLRGTPGSHGVARGSARVLLSLDDAGRLGRGDVLVARTTSPSWTPLFARATALVTDAGGVLSHSAVVAREYGIPAVVGLGVATQAIADGQLVEVDGDAGVVRIIE
jgi:pyruvate,water dikinase